MEIKLQCGCGQRYKFDVDPLNGRMPFSVNCPVCGLDGTGKANELIRHVLANPATTPFTKNMQDKHKSQPNAGLNLNLGDIYHVLFRHKWKIISIWILGTLIAIGLHFTWPVPYSSEARLYVRYVQDNGPITAVGGDPNTRSTTSGAESVINAEGELLHSLDVAKSAAE